MREKTRYAGWYLAITLLLVACSNEPDGHRSVPAETPSHEVADTIYFGGDILTMNDAQPSAEAVAVKDGKIIAVGDLQPLESFYNESTRRIDLKGNTLLPGFFDSHSHLVMTASKLAVVNLDPPPAGPADSITSIQEALRQRLAEHAPAENDWLIGWGYDHSMLAEGRHPTRRDLDEVSPDIPIVVIHFSGHQVVLNSRGLALSNITAASEDPDGGLIFRESGSMKPNGILHHPNFPFTMRLAKLNCAAGCLCRAASRSSGKID